MELPPLHALDALDAAHEAEVAAQPMGKAWVAKHAPVLAAEHGSACARQQMDRIEGGLELPVEGTLPQQHVQTPAAPPQHCL